MDGDGARVDYELLISLIESHPVIYSKKNKHYKIQQIKGNAWKFVADTLNSSGKGK